MTAPLPLNWPCIIPPDGVLDFEFDWSRWLNGGDSINASTFTITPDDTGMVTVSSSSFTATSVTVWLSNGVAGYCSVINHVTTSGGRQMDWTMTLNIKAT
jgi:hypothetical protein